MFGGGDKMIMEIKAINVIASQAPIAILLLSLNGHYGVPKLPTRNRLFCAPGLQWGSKIFDGVWKEGQPLNIGPSDNLRK